MRELFKALEFGVDSNSINKKYKETIQNLKNIKAINEYKNKYYLNNGYVAGKLDINSVGTGYITSFNNNFQKDIIVENKHINGAHLGDIVLANIIKNSKKSRAKAKITMVLQHANMTTLVYTKQIGQAILGVNLQTGIANALKASQKSLKQLPNGTLLLINNTNNEITEVIGNLSDPKVDEKISLLLYDKNSEFSESCQMQANAYTSVEASVYTDRKDLSHLPFCTIDPIDAKDFDDAIYYDKNENSIYVAIADVSEYVSPFSPIDKEAKVRGFSIYFPHKAIPMLPRNLSENICSLKPDVPRLAFCFKIYINSDLKVEKSELFEAVIISKKRYNYDYVDEILNGTKPDELGFIKSLFNLTQKLRQKRLKNAFSFRTNELKIRLDENFMLKETRYESDTNSHNLVEDCMLLANCEAAKRIKFGVFRNHMPPDLKKINDLLANLSTIGINEVYQSDLAALIRKIQDTAQNFPNPDEIDKLIIKSQKKACYDAISKGHFGLGFDTYTHFTSPIRRYSDLILHRILKAKIKNENKSLNFILSDIQETCQNLSVLEREADKTAFDFMDRKFARWAVNNIGKQVRAYVIDNQKELILKLDDELKGARMFVVGNYTTELLTPLLVQIVSADIASTKIFTKVIKKLD